MTAADAAERETGRPLLAALWMLGAVASFSSMAVAGRWLSDAGFTTFEIMFWRSLLGLPLIVIVIARSTAGFAQLATARPGLHALRHTVHFAGQNLWFYAITLITLAEVVALEFTSPVWVALLAPLLLGERFTAARITAALLGFLGVLVITWRGLDAGGLALGLGQAVALGAAIAFALTNIGTKALTRTDSALCIVFWMTLSQLAMALACDLAFRGALPRLPEPELYGAILLIGVAGFGAHFTLTSAYRLADASVVAPMEFARLPVIALAGALIFAENLRAAVLYGGAIIFFGNFINMRAETRRKRARG